MEKIRNSFLAMRDGIKLYTQVYTKGNRPWVVATHGIGEHLGRHGYLTKLLGKHLNILQYDLRGHGHSEGERAYISCFELFQRDLGEILAWLKGHHRLEGHILFGHSMGALISAAYLQNLGGQAPYPKGVFLNAPPVGFPGIAGKVAEGLPSPVLKAFNKIPLSLRLAGLVDLTYLSHDPKIKRDYLLDRHNSLKLHSRLLLEMVRASKEVFSRPLRPKCPAFVTVGAGDHIIDVMALKRYFTATEKGFHLKVFEGAYHEIHNETEAYRRPYQDFLKTTILGIVNEK